MFLLLFLASYLISCGHYSYHREFLNLHFCDSHSGQKTDLRWAHVGPFGQHALPALNVVTDWPKVGGEKRGEMSERLYREQQQKPQAFIVYFGTLHNAGHSKQKLTQCTNLMSCPGRACTRIRTSSSSVP